MHRKLHFLCRKKWKKIEAFCILLIVTLLLIFVRILYQPGTESERGELYTFSNGWYQLEVCIGDRLLYQYKDNRFEKNRQMKGKIWADILCSLWCIFDSGIYQMYGSQNAAGTLISFYAFMTMPVPMLLFVQNTVSESVRWIPQVWIFLLYANAVLQGFLYFLFRIPFIDMLFITHLLLFTGVVSMILLLWKEYRKTQEKEVNLCLKAFGVLGISGVIALVLY